MANRWLSSVALIALLAFPGAAFSDSAEIEFWRSVKQSKDTAELQAYLDAYPEGKFVPLAKLRLCKIVGKANPPKTEPKPEPKFVESPERNKALMRSFALFGDVFERVRSDYVVKPGEKKLIFSAIDGMLRFYPSNSINASAKDAIAKTKSSGGVAVYQLLDVFEAAVDELRRAHPDKTDDNKLIASAINGMLGQLDVHSNYQTARQFQEMQVQATGGFGGLGIEVTMVDGLVTVVTPIAGSPAERAGIEPQNLITHLDAEPVKGLTLAEVVDRMRGKAGSKIELCVKRAKLAKPLVLSVTRDIIRVKTVQHRKIGDVGFIKISVLNGQTAPALKKALKALQKDGIKGLILDLRNNPGGLLDMAIAITDSFLERGAIVSTRSRNAVETQRINAKDGDAIDAKTLVVLTNGGTASGAEIVAAALQDHKRAIVLGENLFGKGSVQTIIPLGTNDAMHLTTTHYHRPSGERVEGNGAKPDIVVRSRTGESSTGASSQQDAQLEAALDLFRASQRKEADGSFYEAEILFWQSVKNSTDPAELAAYLATYSEGRFNLQARKWIIALKSGDKRAGTTKPDAPALPKPAGMP